MVFVLDPISGQGWNSHAGVSVGDERQTELKNVIPSKIVLVAGIKTCNSLFSPIVFPKLANVSDPADVTMSLILGIAHRLKSCPHECALTT